MVTSGLYTHIPSAPGGQVAELRIVKECFGAAVVDDQRNLARALPIVDRAAIAPILCAQGNRIQTQGN